MDLLGLVRSSSQTFRIMREDGAKAIVIATEDGPVSIVAEPDGPGGVLAIVADHDADLARLVPVLELGLGSERTSFYSNLTA